MIAPCTTKAFVTALSSLRSNAVAIAPVSLASH